MSNLKTDLKKVYDLKYGDGFIDSCFSTLRDETIDINSLNKFQFEMFVETMDLAKKYKNEKLNQKINELLEKYDFKKNYKTYENKINKLNEGKKPYEEAASYKILSEIEWKKTLTSLVSYDTDVDSISSEVVENAVMKRIESNKDIEVTFNNLMGVVNSSIQLVKQDVINTEGEKVSKDYSQVKEYKTVLEQGVKSVLENTKNKKVFNPIIKTIIESFEQNAPSQFYHTEEDFQKLSQVMKRELQCLNWVYDTFKHKRKLKNYPTAHLNYVLKNPINLIKKEGNFSDLEEMITSIKKGLVEEKQEDKFNSDEMSEAVDYFYKSVNYFKNETDYYYNYLAGDKLCRKIKRINKGITSLVSRIKKEVDKENPKNIKGFVEKKYDKELFSVQDYEIDETSEGRKIEALDLHYREDYDKNEYVNKINSVINITKKKFREFYEKNKQYFEKNEEVNRQTLSIIKNMPAFLTKEELESKEKELLNYLSQVKFEIPKRKIEEKLKVYSSKELLNLSDEEREKLTEKIYHDLIVDKEEEFRKIEEEENIDNDLRTANDFFKTKINTLRSLIDKETLVSMYEDEYTNLKFKYRTRKKERLQNVNNLNSLLDLLVENQKFVNTLEGIISTKKIKIKDENGEKKEVNGLEYIVGTRLKVLELTEENNLKKLYEFFEQENELCNHETYENLLKIIFSKENPINNNIINNKSKYFSDLFSIIEEDFTKRKRNCEQIKQGITKLTELISDYIKDFYNKRSVLLTGERLLPFEEFYRIKMDKKESDEKFLSQIKSSFERIENVIKDNSTETTKRYENISDIIKSNGDKLIETVKNKLNLEDKINPQIKQGIISEYQSMVDTLTNQLIESLPEILKTSNGDSAKKVNEEIVELVNNCLDSYNQKIYELRQEISQKEDNDKTVSELIDKVNHLADKLNIYIESKEQIPLGNVKTITVNENVYDLSTKLTEEPKLIEYRAELGENIVKFLVDEYLDFGFSPPLTEEDKKDIAEILEAQDEMTEEEIKLSYVLKNFNDYLQTDVMRKNHILKPAVKKKETLEKTLSSLEEELESFAEINMNKLNENERKNIEENDNKVKDLKNRILRLNIFINAMKNIINKSQEDAKNNKNKLFKKVEYRLTPETTLKDFLLDNYVHKFESKYYPEIKEREEIKYKDKVKIVQDNLRRKLKIELLNNTYTPSEINELIQILAKEGIELSELNQKSEVSELINYVKNEIPTLKENINKIENKMKKEMEKYNLDEFKEEISKKIEDLEYMSTAASKVQSRSQLGVSQAVEKSFGDDK